MAVESMDEDAIVKFWEFIVRVKECNCVLLCWGEKGGKKAKNKRTLTCPLH